MTNIKLLVIAFIASIVSFVFLQMLLDFLAMIVNTDNPSGVVVMLLSLTAYYFLKLHDGNKV